MKKNHLFSFRHWMYGEKQIAEADQNGKSTNKGGKKKQTKGWVNAFEI